MITIQAIETRYASCRFRSRLEARWAVFFDTLGIAWEYEPQGFELTWRLDLSDDPLPYLPDFWLPDHHLWIEVKGKLDEPELLRLLNAAASIGAPMGGCGNGGDLVVLGNVPRPDFSTWPARAHLPLRLHMHKGDLIASLWNITGDKPDRGCNRGAIVGRDCGPGYFEDLGLTWHQVSSALLGGGGATNDPRVIAAYTAARSARFEHGETPGGGR